MKMQSEHSKTRAKRHQNRCIIFLEVAGFTGYFKKNTMTCRGGIADVLAVIVKEFDGTNRFLSNLCAFLDCLWCGWVRIDVID